MNNNASAPCELRAAIGELLGLVPALQGHLRIVPGVAKSDPEGDAIIQDAERMIEQLWDALERVRRAASGEAASIDGPTAGAIDAPSRRVCAAVERLGGRLLAFHPSATDAGPGGDRRAAIVAAAGQYRLLTPDLGGELDELRRVFDLLPQTLEKLDTTGAAPNLPRKLSKAQRALWDALNGKALTARELVEAGVADCENIIANRVSAIREKKGEGCIENRKGAGYWRPDAPPPAT